MTSDIVIAGTDTDIGKTVFAAALARALDAAYWKPIQAGLDDETDTEIVRRLAELPEERVLPEVYRLTLPASPHRAAEHDGVELDPSKLSPPTVDRTLLIELAGGLAVPITNRLLQIDMLEVWKRPVVLCAATRLGTINHSLLSIEALKRRAIPVLGVAFIGDENTNTEQTVCRFGGVKRLGRLPRLDPLEPRALHEAFADNFDVSEILGVAGTGP